MKPNPNDVLPNDPPIDEIRKVRHAISERFDHDPAKLVAHLIELQKQYEGRLIDTSKSHEQENPSAA